MFGELDGLDELTGDGEPNKSTKKRPASKPGNKSAAKKKPSKRNVWDDEAIGVCSLGMTITNIIQQWALYFMLV